MKLPDKFTSYSESVIPRFPAILELLEESDLTPHELFVRLDAEDTDHGKIKVNELFGIWDALDCLFALGKIRFDEERSVLSLANVNNM